jgi:maltooligosyltrehalose trehalohydrolase
MSGRRLRVWEPNATRVETHLPADADQALPMSPGEGGWWEGPVVLHGTDYAFAVDGGEPRPDPRSPWQPGGVHGPSRTFDTSLHRWTDGRWPGRDARGAIVYELHVGTFTALGTLDAAIGHLGHLVDLGVEMVELMPVAAFPGGRGWGYDGVALYAVHEAYGGPAALQRFVDAAHRAGLAVCLDVVHNHLGPSGNYLSEFGPYFTERHSTPWGPAINLDGPDAGPVREFILDSVLRWFAEFHVDALRLDAVHALVDDSPRHLLAEMSDVVAGLAETLGRPLSLVAESDLNDATTITPTDQGGLGMTAQWADDVHHALHAALTGERHGHLVDFGSTETLAHALTRVFVHDGCWSTFRDQLWGRPVPAGTDGHRFVVFASNHDQVGNRAIGDRPSESLPPELLAVSSALILTSAFTPMLFMGEEWGAKTPFQYFASHSEPELVESIRVGRAEEFAAHGWTEVYHRDVVAPDPQDPETAVASRLDWHEPALPAHARILDWHRRLIALRRAEPALSDGDLDGVRVRHGETWLVMTRGDLRTAVSWGTGTAEVPLRGPEAGDPPTGVEVLAAWDPVSVVDGVVTFDGPGAAVLRIRSRDPAPRRER